MTNQTNNTIVIAGAGAEGHGVYAGHREGTGPMSYERYLELSDRAGLPREWLMPARQARTQLTRAVRAVASRNRLLVQPGHRMLTELRPFAVRFLVVGALAPQLADPGVTEVTDPSDVTEVTDPSDVTEVTDPTADAGDSLVGRPFGTVVLQVTLYEEPDPTGGPKIQTLDFRGDPVLATQIQAQYDAFVGTQLLKAEDVTAWLNRTYQNHMEGVMSGPAWYIPREHRATAEAICEAFSAHGNWGVGWFNPPVPCATSAQLGIGMARSLCAEVGHHLEELQKARQERREATEDPTAEITPKKAEGFAIRLGMVRRRVDFHMTTLGPDSHAECIAAIEDAMIELDAALEGGAADAEGRIRDLLAERNAEQATAARASTPPAPTLLPLVVFPDGVSFEDVRATSVEVTDLAGYL